MNKNILLGMALTSSLLFSVTGHTDDNDSVIIKYPENEAVDLGLGWDLHKDKSVTNTCIRNFQKYTVDKNLKHEEYTEGNNSYSLQKQVDLSVKESLEVNLKASGAGIGEESFSGSSSMEMQLASSFDMSRDDRYILGKQRIVTRWDAIKSNGGLIELTPEAAELYWKDRDAFFEQCGHGYVARIEYGGTFYSLYNMHSASYSSTSEMKAHLQEAIAEKASANAGVVKSSDQVAEKAELSSHRKVENDVKKLNVSIRVSESGGETSTAGVNVETVMEQYQSFPIRVSKAPTEFRMAIFPYPKPPKPQATQTNIPIILGKVQEPYAILSREYGKWLYLERTIGKLISAEHDGSQSYVYIDGVTPNKKDLEHLQEMAAAKLKVIAKIAIDCMSYIRKNKHPKHNIVVDKCSLKDQQVPFTYWDKKDKKYETSQVSVEESDIYYLPRLPLHRKIFDGLLQDSKKDINYQDMVYNQVNGIYRERCGNNSIEHYCETEAKVEQAVEKYVPDVEGYVYHSYKAGEGSVELCASMENNLRLRACPKASYFAVDHKNQRVRVRLAGNNGKHEDGCLFTRTTYFKKGSSVYYDAYKGMYLNLVIMRKCDQGDPKKSLYWNLVNYNGGNSSMRMLQDLHKPNHCMDVENSKLINGRDIINYPCQNPSRKDINQKWQQMNPSFYLE